MTFYLYPYIQAINLNLRRRCGQTEIVSHCSLLMPLAPAEQSRQLFIGAEQQLLKTWSLILKTISLNLGRRCGQTEIVCHWSLLMSLELAEQSIQLLTCHISRWRLCHRSQQDNQSKSWSKSWKKVWLLFFCHWSLLMLLSPSGQSIQLLICHVSRRRLCHRSLQDNQSESWEKVWPLV